MKLSRSRQGRFMKKREKERRDILSQRNREGNKDLPVVEDPGNQNDSVPSSQKGGDQQTDSQQQDTFTGITIGGRRIVDLSFLAKALEDGCAVCANPLSLARIESEVKRGLSSLLYIKCQCGTLNKVPTGKSHYATGKKKTMPIFDVNTKAAGAMLHAGMGPSHVSSFLSALEIPPLNPKSLKEREREISRHVKIVADKSCKSALEIEKSKSPSEAIEDVTFEEALQLLEDVDSSRTSTPVSKLTLKYDMGWQKRSSGRKYDSLSGVGCMVGQETGKIIAFDTRQKDCRTCTFAERKGSDAPPHNCAKNYEGSSKSMEPDVAVTLVRELETENNVEVSELVMDDDTTTISRIRQELPHEVKKYSDFMHTKKHVTSSLYKLQKKHKSMSTDVIKYFVRGFTYALNQNKGDEDSVKLALQAIVPHAFGDHSHCGEWCGSHSSTETYKHKSLPNGQPLKDMDLKEDLHSIFSTLIVNVSRIAPCFSTKENESFNAMVASKAPKSRHYSSSESFRSRVECSVAQKNLGHGYLSQVFASSGLSPGTFYSQHAVKTDIQRKRCNTHKISKETKRRRLNFSIKKRNTQAAAEVREGVTYASQVDAGPGTGDIDAIPSPVCPPKYQPLSDISGSHMCFFDLETTSLSSDCDITQIAACHRQETYNRYIFPQQPILPKVSEITGIKMFSGRMYHHGKQVEAIDSYRALSGFIEFLEETKPVLLTAHNCKTFDANRLVYHLEKHQLFDRFQEVVVGFLDTLPLFKATFKLPNYKQTTIVDHTLKEGYSAHNALEDAKVLEKAYEASADAFKQEGICLVKYTFLPTDTLQKIKCDKEKSRNLPSLRPLLADKILGSTMVEKVASSGLNMHHLKLAYDRDESDGIRHLFTELNRNGCARVTKSKKCISKVVAFFS